MIGDSLGLTVSLYLVVEAVRLRLGVATVARMLFNVVLDWLIGLVPLADVFLDAAFKANTRNTLILKAAIERH